MEAWDGEQHPKRGTEGLLSVHSTHNEVHPLCNHFIEASKQLQIPFNEDYNADDMEGAALFQITTQNGWRGSTARCYLRPALRKKNLTLQTNAHVTRLLSNGSKIEQVEYTQHGKTITARARAEVIVCAGAVNSPQLLELSGIGNSQLLLSLIHI